MDTITAPNMVRETSIKCPICGAFIFCNDTSAYTSSPVQYRYYCPECGELVVRLEEYDPSKTYICPECGEELDLYEQYGEDAPVITREIIEVK